MKKDKFYTVWTGRISGVYIEWDKTAEQVDGFPGSDFKSFSTVEQAQKAFAMGAGAYRQSVTDGTFDKEEDEKDPILW